MTICHLPEEAVYLPDGFGKGEDRDPVVRLDHRVADRYDGVVAPDDSADDCVRGELQVLDGPLGDCGAGAHRILHDLGVGPGHVADYPRFSGEGQLEDASGGQELLVDDVVHAHLLGYPYVLDVLDFGHRAGHSEFHCFRHCCSGR